MNKNKMVNIAQGTLQNCLTGVSSVVSNIVCTACKLVLTSLADTSSYRTRLRTDSSSYTSHRLLDLL